MSFPRILFPTLEIAHHHTPFFIEEEGLGIWLSTDDPVLLTQFPPVYFTRDGIHLPSVDQHGTPLPDTLRQQFLTRAAHLGLTHTHPARGYWTLSETGQLQDEDVIIAFSETPVSHPELLALAQFVLEIGNQDAVAYEMGGEVLHARRTQSPQKVSQQTML